MAILFKNSKDNHEASQLRGIQIILILFSVMFVFILYQGWYTLFSHYGAWIATIGAVVLAALAWSLGKFIGSSEGGITSNGLLFLLLLLLSAAGVFNWMMITLEGRTIFLESVVSTEDTFTQLSVSARKNVTDATLAAKEADVIGKQQSFLAEVRNPLNCGYGPVARQRQAELEVILPELRLPSPPQGRAAQSAEQCIARSEVYRQAIEDAWNATSDGKRLNGIRSQLASITARVDQATAQLDALRNGANNNGVGYILGSGRNELQRLNEVYRTQLAAVRTYAPDPDLPSNLNLTTLSRLGEWSQIVSVMISRLDTISTYVYLALSVLLDYLLVHLFARYRVIKLRQPNRAVITKTAVRHLGAEEV